MEFPVIDVDSLPFSNEKKRAVLGHVMLDRDFFNATINKLEPEWFSNEIEVILFRAIKSWKKKWDRCPTEHELLDSEEVITKDPAVINQIRGMVNTIKNERQKFLPAPLLAEMETWVKTRTLQIGLPKVSTEFNKRRIDKAVEILNSTVKEFYEIRFQDDGQSKFENFGSSLATGQINQNYKPIYFGVAGIDSPLDPTGENGPMVPGDLTVLLAPTNVGKTTALITVACNNILRGRSVLFITHEGRPEDIKMKFLRCITGKTESEVRMAYRDFSQASKMHDWEKLLDMALVYVPINKPGITVEEVASIIERMQDNRKMAFGGRGFDLLVDDYPAKLSTEMAKGGQMQLRHIHEYVYSQFVQIALKHKLHVLTVVQTNRDGSKLNRRTGIYKSEKRLLHMEDVQESWGVMTNAANVISINRNAEDAENNKLTYLLCKSRSGETGWAVVCNTDYDRQRTHSNDQGYFTYRGEEALGSKSVDLMRAYQNQVVKSDVIKRMEEAG